jgi:hypothetical protein
MDLPLPQLERSRQRVRRRLLNAGALALLLLLGCSCAHVPKRRVQELEPVLAQVSYLPSGPEDFSFLDRLACGKKMLFLGEIPHHEWPIYETTLQLSLHLRQQCGYSVLAMESAYSYWPYLEARSLGTEAQLPNRLPDHQNRWLEPVTAYNRTAPAERRLLCTALDLDHCISHAKSQTVLYLQYLATKSSSREARAYLAQAIPALVDLKSRKAIHAYLEELERRFHAAWDSFTPADQEEITFSLALERASIDFHALSYWYPPDRRKAKIRDEYFRQTIARALAKAEQAGGPLLCYVGWGHAWLHQRGALNCEAAYFDQEFPATRGQVGSLLIEKLSACVSSDLSGDYRPSALERAALARMGKQDRLFVDLRDPRWDSVKHKPGKFFPKGGPDYDGILFLK